MLVALVVLKREKIQYRPQKKDLGLLLLRSVCGTIGILGNFYAVDRLLLADANMLNKLSPFFTVVFSYLILKEKIRPLQAVGLVAAFGGSLLIVKPSFDFSQMLPSLVGVAGGIGAGAAYAFIRLLGKRKVPGPVIVLCFSAFSTLATVPTLIFDYTPMNLTQTVLLLLAGVSASIGQFAITKAYQYAPASEISVFDYSQVVFAAILGFFVFRQIPDVYSFLGYGIIFAAAIAMYLYNNRRQETT